MDLGPRGARVWAERGERHRASLACRGRAVSYLRGSRRRRVRDLTPRKPPRRGK
ncbi:hypothetical protein UKMH10_1161 [Burkholderia pseudomallei]|nr:hypothetical protein UKMH10_1161 [Burkholderia pseudomallei]